MASRVVTQLISDLSGDEIAEGGGETVDFAYRGVNYSIDLTGKEASGFDKSIAMYIKHATKKSNARRMGSGASASQPGDAKAVRSWAKDQGIEVPDRGRIPAQIRDQYEAINRVR